ncbi:MAG TPA: hypothetical protein QGG32_09695 [Rhodospirillales bacterium]|nr:hypothetical protein [Rhodospirillales bacterium]
MPEPAGGENQKHVPAIGTLRARVRGTNINEQTLLATGFLNYFNEIVMTLEMLPDMPELLEEIKAWQPKTYQDHFRDRVFTEKDLAIKAYRHAPAKCRRALETTIVQISRLIGIAVKRAEVQLAENKIDAVRTDITHRLPPAAFCRRPWTTPRRSSAAASRPWTKPISTCFWKPRDS